MITSLSVRKRLWLGKSDRPKEGRTKENRTKEGEGEERMRKALRKRMAVAAVGLLLLASAAGCGGAKEGEIYPLTVDGTDITLDVTTMQAIYDAGFEVTVLDTSTMDRYEIAADTPLDADSVYTGVNIGKNGDIYASLSVVTEDACAMSESVIYGFTGFGSYGDKITIASVPLTELNEEKAKEIEKKLEDGEYFQSYVSDSRILRITRENGAAGAVTQLEVEVRYEIDYTG